MPHHRAASPQPTINCRHEPWLCATCELEVAWTPVQRGGQRFCCAGLRRRRPMHLLLRQPHNGGLIPCPLQTCPRDPHIAARHPYDSRRASSS